jgi:3-oxoadipate enol-lactonase
MCVTNEGSVEGFGYAATGPKGGQAIVFLHGIGGRADVFAPQLEALSDRYRAVAWDMPGYGRSTLPPESSIASMTDRLADFLKAMRLERPVLIGHSLGGMIVQDYLARGLGPVRAVALVATSPAFGRPDGDWQQDFVRSRLGPLDAGHTMSDLAESLVSAIVGDDPDPNGRAQAVESMAAVAPEAYRAAVKSLIGFDRRVALGKIAVPCLVLAGEKDTIAPADMMRRMTDKIPGARYFCLAGTGHLPNLERPAEFNAALKDFLASLGPPEER